MPKPEKNKVSVNMLQSIQMLHRCCCETSSGCQAMHCLLLHAHESTSAKKQIQRHEILCSMQRNNQQLNLPILNDSEFGFCVFCKLNRPSCSDGAAGHSLKGNRTKE